jgi:hypothetical protein
LSDGRSDGHSSCPECTQAPGGIGGGVLGATTEGQVLGASTDFAATGTAVDDLMNSVGIVGTLSTLSGVLLMAKKRFNK